MKGPGCLPRPLLLSVSCVLLSAPAVDTSGPIAQSTLSATAATPPPRGWLAISRAPHTVVGPLRRPATPSLPSMRGWFTTPSRTSHPSTTAQVRSAALGWIMGGREVARSAVSGKSLARTRHGGLFMVVDGRSAGVVNCSCRSAPVTARGERWENACHIAGLACHACRSGLVGNDLWRGTTGCRRSIPRMTAW
jgi:hypothetical protein